METKLRFINGLLQADSEEPGEPGQEVTDLIFDNGLLNEVTTTTKGDLRLNE